ncbi:hypothetical protein DXC15_13405 [Ruminococcus sp. OM08-13AT]|nr:hypothetical protein DXC15_13405 [Ruminococcus sp. OM08-13AT]RGI54712.1 hypothetical protein DXA86_12980 [Ruminococcus sp. OF05-2BH]
MKEKEALEYEPFLNVKEGENLKLEVAEYDKKNNGVYNCYNEDKTAKFFDEKSGNFHLMPKDKDKVKEYLEKEIEKKKECCSRIIERCVKTRMAFNKKWKRNESGLSFLV